MADFLDVLALGDAFEANAGHGDPDEIEEGHHGDADEDGLDRQDHRQSL